MKHPFLIVEVFTRDRLSGNPLAIVMDSEHLKDSLMMRVAAEFGFSQTAFMRAPQDAKHLASLRVFTSRKELAFAGHPTIGAAVVLGLKKRTTAIRLEQPIGVVTSVMERIDDHVGSARFNMPRLPAKVRDGQPAEVVAGALGLLPEDVGFGDFAPSVWSAGLTFTLVPVRDTEALSRIRIQRRGWRDVFSDGDGAVYAFAPGEVGRGFDYAARMFAPTMGIDEEPGSGAAAAALGGAVAEASGLGDGGHALVIRQGIELERPCTIELQIRITDGVLDHVAIGGSAVILVEGTIDLPA